MRDNLIQQQHRREPRHLGKQAGPHANSICLVDGKPRVSIAETRTEGTPWTDRWHHVRVVRTVKDGLIRVYFDDMDKPAMTAHATTNETTRPTATAPPPSVCSSWRDFQPS